MENILVIDDDDGILSFATKMLCHFGYQVKTAHDGEEGIELLRNCTRFKAVITDIRMPKKDGNQVAKYIRDDKKISYTPILAITGFPEEAEDGLFDCVLTKPIKMRDVISLINTLG
jgi:CheY-like chemotaxis protein